MEENADGASTRHENRSYSSLEHENKNMNDGTNSEQGQKVGNSNNEGVGRENASMNKGKKSYASFFKDNRAPTDTFLLSFITPPAGKLVIEANEIDSVEETTKMTSEFINNKNRST